MADNVIVQVPVDVMTWYRANKAMLMKGTTLESKLREYMHYLAKQSRDYVQASENPSERLDPKPPKRSGVRCYDKYAHRVIDTSEIWSGGTPEVVEALPLEDYWIEVRFNDGRHGVFNMQPYLGRPAFAKLKDVEVFNQLFIRDGVVCWSEDLDIATERMWTDCEPVIEHWTYPEDWPKVGDKGPDGSPIVFVTDKGFPVADKLEDKWGEEADRAEWMFEPGAPLLPGPMPSSDELERMDQEERKKKAGNPGTEIEQLRKDSTRFGRESDSLASRNFAQQQQICKLLLSMRKHADVSLEEMSKRTGISASELWKAEDGSSRASLLDYLADYCTALGKTFTISFDDCEEAGKERN
ncbi:DUF2442 domain-containing protein [Bifidobacterium imperatoris]|uniref:DUF2442 domain-containing protein n=1 Tax=Bifidobacterium imperatoris TaxID=2020965 RepID=A0A2N5IVE6_9BIFI|nr:DUF2442 domain-containing protein [Bifidobacterium imperatoris]PLS25943.1 hypothetical protein Tam1G_0094 [Bifidobacterium imperatoris]QSY57592.1 DUF2442 domain-containing protein [Bifidobacterium imperatoris]